MLPHEITAQAAIRALYGRPVTYAGKGGPPLVGVIAIRENTPADRRADLDGRAGSVSFEFEKSALPSEPIKGDTITEASGARWKVIDRDDLDDVESWVVFVETVS